jgi:hypothetical protein
MPDFAELQKRRWQSCNGYHQAWFDDSACTSQNMATATIPMDSEYVNDGIPNASAVTDSDVAKTVESLTAKKSQ